MSNVILLSIYGKIDEDDKIVLSKLSEHIIERNQLIGGGEITEAVIIAVSPLVIKALKELVLVLMSKDVIASIKVGDIEIKNISSSKLPMVINELNSMISHGNYNKKDKVKNK